MGDIDAGTVKATVRIVLEDEGTQQAEERLNAIKAAAGDAGGAVASAGDNFAQFGEQASTSAEGAKSFSATLADLPKITESGTSTILGMTEALGGGQQALLETGSAFEALQAPVGTSVEMLQDVAPPMALIGEHAQSLQEQLAPVNESFAQLGDTTAQSVIALPQFADSLHTVDRSFNAAQYGLNDFNENMNVFQDALVNPAPFSMIQQHLNETGQTWQDFTSSIGEGNSAILENMATSTQGISSNVGAMGKTFYESAHSAEAFTRQFNGLGEAVTNVDSSINAFGGVGSLIYGPDMAIDSSIGGAFSSTFANMGEAFGGAMMPIMMGAQMAIMAAQQIGQAIYDSASIAEGPAAHSMGTFTGAVDALNQTAAAAGAQFSESFGRQVIPTLDAMNYQLAQSGGMAGDLGSELGGTFSFLSNVAGGAIAPLLLANPFTVGAGMGIIQGSYEGLINQGASLLGYPMPFQGPGPVPQAQASYEQQFIQMPQNVRAQTYQTYTQSAQLLQMASDPGYLASQDQLSAAQQIYQRAQASYDASHPVNQAQLLREYQYRQYADSQGPPDLQYPSYGQSFTDYWGPIFSGIGKFLTEPIPAAKNYPGLQSMGASNLDFSGITGDIGQALSSIHLPHLDLSGIASNIGGAISGIQLPHIDLSSIGSSLSGAFSGIQMPHLDLSSISSSLSGAFSSISLPSLPDLGSRISSELSGMFSGITLPSIPDFGARLSGALSGMFAGIGLPTIPDIGAMLNGALSGMFSGIAIPKPPDLGAMLTGAMSGIFSGISLPPIPNLGAALSGALSSMLGSVGTAIPGFAGGVENFSGGPAFIAEGGRPELVMLPQGSSVYPLSTGSAAGGNLTPISLGGGGGSTPQSANIFLQIDGQTFWSATGISLAQSTRAVSGYRGY